MDRLKMTYLWRLYRLPKYHIVDCSHPFVLRLQLLVPSNMVYLEKERKKFNVNDMVEKFN